MDGLCVSTRKEILKGFWRKWMISILRITLRIHTNANNVTFIAQSISNLWFFPPNAPFLFANPTASPSPHPPTRHSSFPDRKSLKGLSPSRRWPFNTSLATANEPGAAAAWIDPADSAQMFISRSPAVLGREVALQPWLNFTLLKSFYFGTVSTRGVYWLCHTLLFIWNTI